MQHIAFSEPARQIFYHRFTVASYDYQFKTKHIFPLKSYRCENAYLLSCVNFMYSQIYHMSKGMKIASISEMNYALLHHGLHYRIDLIGIRWLINLSSK